MAIAFMVGLIIANFFFTFATWQTVAIIGLVLFIIEWFFTDNFGS